MAMTSVFIAASIPDRMNIASEHTITGTAGVRAFIKRETFVYIF
jgi:hypothetical protein